MSVSPTVLAKHALNQATQARQVNPENPLGFIARSQVIFARKIAQSHGILRVTAAWPPVSDPRVTRIIITQEGNKTLSDDATTEAAQPRADRAKSELGGRDAQ